MEDEFEYQDEFDGFDDGYDYILEQQELEDFAQDGDFENCVGEYL